MKKLLYKFLSDSGYRVVNKRKERKTIKAHLSKYHIIENQELLYSVFKYIKRFENKFNSITIKNEGLGFLFSFDETTVYLESYNEFFILNEIFYSKCYEFITNDNIVVIDIGANIGLASLFFSRKSNVKKIYAFEPVTKTYNQAKQNFKLNPDNKVVEIYNFGLGLADKVESFVFNKNLKGNTGTLGSLNNNKLYKETEKVEVNIKKASPIIEQITSQNKEYKIFLKIDCEGAEYEIFKDFEATSILDKVDYIMMEWHNKGSDDLEKTLVKYKFNYFLQVLGSNSGMIYAYKRHD